MLHRLNKNLCYYHIPKTGGRAYLVNNSRRAMWHRYVDEHNPKFKIIVHLRCPVDRFLSAYYYVTGKINKASNRRRRTLFDHLKKKEFLKETPLETLEHIVNNNIDVDQLNNGEGLIYFSTQYKWHENLEPENVLYESFQKYKKNSKSRKKFASKRPLLEEEAELDKIIEKVKIIYNKDYEYFKNITQASESIGEWL